MKLTAESTVFNEDAVQSKFAELVVDADGIRTEVGKKVGNDEVISRINQSAESIQIQASKVAIEADNFVTQFGTDGVKLHPKNDDLNYTTIDPTNGMNVYKGGVSVASYDDITRIGLEHSSHIKIHSSKIEAFTSSGANLFSLNENGGLKNMYKNIGRTRVGSTSVTTINLSTALGTEWTDMASGTIFRVHVDYYCEGESGQWVSTELYASDQCQFTKGTASTSGTLSYSGNTLTINRPAIPSSSGGIVYTATGEAEFAFTRIDIVQAPFYNFADDGPISGGANSFVIGTGTIAGNPNQLALGAYNAERLNGLLIIGGGTSSARKNLAVVTDTGDLYLKGNLYVGSNDAGTSGTKANSGIDIASYITFGSAWTQQVKVARQIGNMVFFQLEANAGTFNANTNYVLANIASGYRPAVQQFATGITTDGSYNPKGTVSAVLKTDGSINIRTQTASSSGAFVFISGFYYTA